MAENGGASEVTVASAEVAAAAPAAADVVVKKRKILVAVDPSDESVYALTWALENVIQKEDKVHLLHAQGYPHVYAGPAGPVVFPEGASPLCPGFYVPPEVIETLKKQEENVSRSVLKAAKELCSKHGIHPETDVIEGEPREAICDAVDQLGINLLIIGSHGYGAIKRAFLGSVSDYCVHHASCPVVVVRKDQTGTAKPEDKQS